MNKLSTSDTDSVQRNSPLELCKGMEDNIQSLPLVEGDMSDVKLLEVLSTIENYIEEYGSNYSTLPEVRQAASLKHKNIHSKLIQIKLIAAERSYINIVSYSSELGTKLEAYKIKWSLMNLKGSWNADNFTGFNSFDFLKAASNLPTSNNQQRLINELQKRISLLEDKLSTVNSLNLQDPSIKQIGDSTEILDSMITRITALEKKNFHNLQMMEELANKVQDHVDDLNSRIDDFSSLLNSKQNSYCSTSMQSDTNMNVEVDSLLEPESLFLSNNSTEEQLPVSSESDSKFVHGSPDNINTNSTNVEEAFNNSFDILEDSLMRQSRALGRYLFPEPKDFIDKQTLRNVYNITIPNVNKHILDLQKSLHMYMQLEQPDNSICIEVLKSLNNAEKWAEDIHKLQKKINIYQPNVLKLKKCEKHVNSISYPCTLKGHKHILSDCNQFFKMNPKQRVLNKKLLEYKYCSVCLQSNSLCKFNKCSNMKFVPEILVCQECKYSCALKGSGCYSVLYCLNANHTKPSNADILKALTCYLPGFDSTRIKAPIRMAFKSHNLTFLSRDRNHFKRFPIDVHSESNSFYKTSQPMDCLKFQAYREVYRTDPDNVHTSNRRPLIDGQVSQFWSNVSNMDWG